MCSGSTEGKLADAIEGVVWRQEGGVDFSRCLSQEIVCIGGQADMQSSN